MNKYYEGATEQLKSVNSFAISNDNKKGIKVDKELKRSRKIFDGRYRKNDKFDKKTWEKCSQVTQDLTSLIDDSMCLKPAKEKKPKKRKIGVLKDLENLKKRSVKLNKL